MQALKILAHLHLQCGLWCLQHLFFFVNPASRVYFSKVKGVPNTHVEHQRLSLRKHVIFGWLLAILTYGGSQHFLARKKHLATCSMPIVSIMGVFVFVQVFLWCLANSEGTGRQLSKILKAGNGRFPLKLNLNRP